MDYQAFVSSGRLAREMRDDKDLAERLRVRSLEEQKKDQDLRDMWIAAQARNRRNPMYWIARVEEKIKEWLKGD